MCGIFGYVGHREAEPILISGLQRLEYRGYDSAGLATLTGSDLHLRKCAGRIGNLVKFLKAHPSHGCAGMSHTRWATHGAPTETNAHPHLSNDGQVAIVHNGVIDNYASLRDQLEAEGVVFKSTTDSEVIAQLIAHHLRGGDLRDTLPRVLPMLKGSYALVVMSPRNPDELIGACLGSPLVLGLGRQENFLSSDARALAGQAKQVVHLQDHQMCTLAMDRWQILDQQSIRVEACVQDIECQVNETDKGEFDHYMLKEIYEQPDALENTMRGRLLADVAEVQFESLRDLPRLAKPKRLILTGCGTSYHAALVGEYLLEEFARIPVEVEYASELRYRNSPLDPDTTVLAITQSGETADTLAALRDCKRKGHPTMALCNVVGSTIAREADASINLRAGPEVGVASTKAFTCQVTALTMLAIFLGRQRSLSRLEAASMIEALQAIPNAMRRALRCHEQVRCIAERYAESKNMLYLGRQYLFPAALEGALKLKELSYIHAEGYPAAEMKHGPIALVDENTPSVFLLSRGEVYDKVMSNLEEVKARGGPVIAIATEGDKHIASRADEVIYVPAVPHYLQPLVAIVPLQLLAYHIALLRCCDVDKPRNLAKSVTVE